MSEPNNDIHREPTFTYSLDPKSIRVTYIQKCIQESMESEPRFHANISYIQYGGDDYKLPGECSVEYSFCDGALKVEGACGGKSLNAAALKIILERLRELGEAVLKAGGEIPCPGCTDYSCPTHGCPPEKLLTRRQVAARNLREGPQFHETDAEWEVEKAKWLAIIAEEDAK
jgi:hypothetical protein